MATLPTGGTNLTVGFTTAGQPSQTWYLDRNTGRIRGRADGLEAVRQAVDIILNIQRFRGQIFLPSSGMDWKGLIGQDPGYVVAELQRRLWDALRMDDRILGLEDFQYQMTGDTLTVSFTVKSVFGSLNKAMEVMIG